MNWTDLESLPPELRSLVMENFTNPLEHEEDVYGLICERVTPAIPFIDLLESQVDQALVVKYGLERCEEIGFLPIFHHDIRLVCVVTQPWSGRVINQIREIFFDSVRIVATTPTRFKRCVEHVQKDAEKLTRAQVKKAATIKELQWGLSRNESLLVQDMIRNAHAMGASDIHLEPMRDRLAVRFRINGVLVPQEPVEKGFMVSVLDGVKDMATLPTNERSTLRSARFSIDITPGYTIDLRVEKGPISGNQETIVMRLLDSENIQKNAGKLPFPDNLNATFMDCLNAQNGLIIMTGPTGSGKTTTLYRALTSLDLSRKKVLTIEDPIEYPLDKVVQMQVDAKNDVTFTTALRSFVRMDPDVIMVGEIRDSETANLALSASNTGHLVLSTMHTNDAVGVIPRLQDFGMTRQEIQSTLSLAVAQRLIKSMCEKCKYQLELSLGQQRHFKHYGLDVPTKMCKGSGCAECNNSGVAGRQAIFEFFRMSDEMRVLLCTDSTIQDIKQANQQVFPNLVVSALDAAARCITDYETVRDYETHMSNFLD
jgi:type IV pilus assembly protein PilB